MGHSSVLTGAPCVAHPTTVGVMAVTYVIILVLRKASSRGSGGGGLFGGSKPSPAPAQRSQAPPPSTQTGGGGMMGGLMSTVAQGMAFGAGSGIAHRGVDAVMGPRTMEVTHTNAGGEGAAGTGAPNEASSGTCGNFKKAFMDCVNNSDGDISRCQMYHDALQECKRSAMM